MSNLSIIRAFNNTGMAAQLYQDQPGYLAWSNVDFRTSPPNGDTPINLILRLLISTGKGTNWSGTGTNYDVYEAGVGLGIPQDQIDIASFTAASSQYDWDINQRLFFHITEPEPAKEFIDQELCRPFGLYLRTGNDGIIRCVRPRHPQKFYIGDANRRLRVIVGGTTYTAELPIGVYDGTQLALKVPSAFNVLLQATPYRFECSYNLATWKFTVTCWNYSSFDPVVRTAQSFDLVASPDQGWVTMGYTGDITGTTSATSHAERGKFSGVTLTQNDMWAVQTIDNRDEQISSVIYAFDYDVDKEQYRTSLRYEDEETMNLGDTFGPHDYLISSRGLISAATTSASWVVHFAAPLTGCIPRIIRPLPAVGVDADTWSQLYALTLIDRYKHPPMKFRAKLKWTWNTLEVGDVVKIDYGIPGVFADHELNASVLTGRLFEIIELHPNFDGSLNATFLGHKYVNY